MIKVRNLVPEFSKKYKKDPRVVAAILQSPFLFIDSVFADDYDYRAIRMPYFGVFNLKPKYRKKYEKGDLENNS